MCLKVLKCLNKQTYVFITNSVNYWKLNVCVCLCVLLVKLHVHF